MNSKSDSSRFFSFQVRPWSLITAAGTVTSTTTILGFFGSLHWFFDLCANFRVQYFLALSIGALLLLIPKQRKTALAFAIFALANLATIIPLFFGDVPEATPSSHPVRALLINVNTRAGSLERVRNAIERYNPDILVLEEVDTNWIAGLSSTLSDYKFSESDPRDDNFGIAFYSKLPTTRLRILHIGDAWVPSIMAEVQTRHGPCTILATHPVPPSSPSHARWRDDQFIGLADLVRKEPNPVLLLGDLNATPWSANFRLLLRNSGLKDSSQGRGPQPTWPTINPLLLIPIDHCLYSPPIQILRKEVTLSAGSDHYPVLVDFIISQTPTGK